MRISENSNIDGARINQSIVASTPIVEKVVKQGSEAAGKVASNFDKLGPPDAAEETKVKAQVQEAVKKMNEMLEVNQSTSKFMYHEGLERYYVTVVNKDTEEVVKEIPPKKLLDAFYEMQKMLGMIVDEKI